MALAEPHTVRAALPAAKRLGKYLVVVAIIVVIGSYWVTDGFSRLPDWTHFRQWVRAEAP